MGRRGLLWLGLQDSEEADLASISTREVPSDLEESTYSEFPGCKNCRSNRIFSFQLSVSSVWVPNSFMGQLHRGHTLRKGTSPLLEQK